MKKFSLLPGMSLSAENVQDIFRKTTRTIFLETPNDSDSKFKGRHFVQIPKRLCGLAHSTPLQ